MSKVFFCRQVFSTRRLALATLLLFVSLFMSSISHAAEADIHDPEPTSICCLSLETIESIGDWAIAATFYGAILLPFTFAETYVAPHPLNPCVDYFMYNFFGVLVSGFTAACCVKLQENASNLKEE